MTETRPPTGSTTGSSTGSAHKTSANGARTTVLIPEGHSRPIGKYSPGVLLDLSAVDGLVFVSGQVATDDGGNVIGRDDAAAQAGVVFQRIAQVLAAADAGLSDIVQLTIYLADVARDFAAVSGVRNRVLPSPPPSSTLVEVSRLAEDGCLVEISAIASRTGPRR
jgi:enamine deaminase RidA (YjgF/YER057c/UK114 family)